MRYKLADIFVRLKPNLYLKGSEIYHYLKQYPDQLTEIEFFVPGLRGLYLDHAGDNPLIRVYTEGKVSPPELQEGDGFTTFVGDDEQLSRYDFLVLPDKKYLLKRIKNKENIIMIDPKIKVRFELIYGTDLFFNPLTDRLQI